MKISGDRLFSEVERIAGMGDRRSGSDVEHRAMEHIRCRFAEIGLENAEIEWFDMNFWNPTCVELDLLPEGQSIRSKPIWYTGPTSAEGVQGECVYCGYGMPQQFGSARERIAVIDGRILLHFWSTHSFFQSYRFALEAGAKALIVVIDAPGDLIPIYTADEDKPDNPMPAVLISRSDGAALKDRMDDSGAELRIALEAETRTSRTADVVATLPGKTDEYLIVGAHHDAIYRGAVDNAGGVAALLAIAEQLAGRSEPPNKNIILATHPGHELSIGARQFIKARKDLLEKTAAYVTLDGIGCDNYEEVDGRIRVTGRDEKRGAFISPNPTLAEIVIPAMEKYGLRPSAFLSADIMCPNPDLEGRFFEAGVPIVDIIGKPIWYHTEEDTPDKCTPDQLLRGTLAQLEVIEGIDARPAAEIRAGEGKLSDPRSLIKKGAASSKPKIEFTHLPEVPKAGEPSLLYVTDFDDSESLLVDMAWKIAGESGSKGPAVLQVFDSPGEYLVELTVTNKLGAEGRCDKRIAVE
jgi:hypothetical protein